MASYCMEEISFHYSHFQNDNQQLAIMNGVLSIREVGKIINRHLADVPNDRHERRLI